MRLIGGVVHYREARRGGRHQPLDLEGSELAVHWYSASPEAPHREELREELEAVAEMEENSVAGPEAAPFIARAASRHLARHRRGIPAPAGQWLDEMPGRHAWVTAGAADH
jgi:hypothetical protein